MPSTLFHLKVAYEFSQKYKQYDVPMFFLGTIAPDAVNLNGFAKKEVRWKTHHRDYDLHIWKENIISLYKNSANNINNPYLLGYIFHILTDIVVDDLYLNNGIYRDILQKRH